MVREKRDRHHFKKRAGWKDYHHFRIPCSRGGQTISSNLLCLDAYRHDALHLLFADKTLKETILFLRKFENRKSFLKSINNYHKHRAYNLLFGKKEINEIILLFKRVESIKNSQKLRSMIILKKIA